MDCACRAALLCFVFHVMAVREKGSPRASFRTRRTTRHVAEQTEPNKTKRSLFFSHASADKCLDLLDLAETQHAALRALSCRQRREDCAQSLGADRGKAKLILGQAQCGHAKVHAHAHEAQRIVLQLCRQHLAPAAQRRVLRASWNQIIALPTSALTLSVPAQSRGILTPCARPPDTCRKVPRCGKTIQRSGTSASHCLTLPLCSGTNTFAARMLGHTEPSKLCAIVSGLAADARPGTGRAKPSDDTTC